MDKKLRIIIRGLGLLFLILSLTVAPLASAAGAPRVTTLSGAEEVPARATPGTGFASITLNVGQRMVCWELSWSNLLAPATAAHIHFAPVGVNGGVVVPLAVTPTTTGYSSGCQENVNAALIQAIIDFPERYYVNVHTSVFPGGEIRGQLSNPGQSE